MRQRAVLCYNFNFTSCRPLKLQFASGSGSMQRRQLAACCMLSKIFDNTQTVRQAYQQLPCLRPCLPPAACCLLPLPWPISHSHILRAVLGMICMWHQPPWLRQVQFNAQKRSAYNSKQNEKKERRKTQEKGVKKRKRNAAK